MKFNEWTIKDHYPEMALQDIQPISLRAYSLLNRNISALGPNEGALHKLKKGKALSTKNMRLLPI